MLIDVSNYPEWIVAQQLAKASPSGLCHAERHGFEHPSDHARFICTFHLLLFQFAPFFCKLVLLGKNEGLATI